MNIKNICGFIISVAFCAMTLCVVPPAHAGLATVGAVHEYVHEKWGVEIPRTHTDTSLLNMRYLMQLVDAANFALNGWETSDYAADAQYATSALAAGAVGKKAADTLIEKVEWKFFFTPAATTNEYLFNISAAGHFYIDWGDGEKEFIHKKDVTVRTISHTYTDGAANTHEIKLGGHATAYSTGKETAAIGFGILNEKVKSGMELKSIRGCLGCVFSTIEDESVPENQRQPRFTHLFRNNEQLDSEIPEGLFKGVHGVPVSQMFNAIFYGCSSLRGTIPENLFDGIDGAPAEGTFYGTFGYCSSLTGSIPENLFSGLKGGLTANLFDQVFYGCSKLTGEIPKNLFAGIETTGDYSTDAFRWAFSKCTSLTGPSAKIGDRYLYEIWPDVSGQKTYSNDKQLTDYACIPTGWGGGGTKPVGTCEPASDAGADGGD